MDSLFQPLSYDEVGVHYDLRLQFSESSSISFAIPYGLPGNPNSLRPNRMAIETRVHNLWVGPVHRPFSLLYAKTVPEPGSLINFLEQLD